MARYVGVGLENQDFLGPEMARAKRVPFGPKKVDQWGGGGVLMVHKEVHYVPMFQPSPIGT